MENLEIAWLAGTLVGMVLIIAENGKLKRVYLDLKGDPEERAREMFPDAKLSGDSVRQIAEVFKEYFNKRNLTGIHRLDLIDDVDKTPFFHEVYRCLKEVAPGTTVTYGELAARAGYPRAARAVGLAMATNPVPIAIPCHRVVPQAGGLGNFGGGIHLKKALLEHEGYIIKT